MNRAAARSYPFQVIRKFMFNRPGEVFYIGGNDSGAVVSGTGG